MAGELPARDGGFAEAKHSDVYRTQTGNWYRYGEQIVVPIRHVV